MATADRAAGQWIPASAGMTDVKNDRSSGPTGNGDGHRRSSRRTVDPGLRRDDGREKRPQQRTDRERGWPPQIEPPDSGSRPPPG